MAAASLIPGPVGGCLSVLWQMTPRCRHHLLLPATREQQRLHLDLISGASDATQQSSCAMDDHVIT